MAADVDDVRARLESIAEELGDMALDRLRESAEGADPRLSADERRFTRARRAVERAVAILADVDPDSDSGEPPPD